MRYYVIILLLLPCFLYGQNTKEDYEIYSKYLKEYQSHSKVPRMRYVVRTSSEYFNKYDHSDIRDVIDGLRGYLAHDPMSTSIIALQGHDMLPIVKNDTLWIPLIIKLQHKVKNDLTLSNKFSPDLLVHIMDIVAYNSYFKDQRNFRKDWELFHEKYPNPSALVELSPIANDGKRAVFYFSAQCGGLCGIGQLVFFTKEAGEWKYLATIMLWQS